MTSGGLNKRHTSDTHTCCDSFNKDTIMNSFFSTFFSLFFVIVGMDNDCSKITILYVIPIDYDKNIFVHLTYCSSMRKFPRLFHNLWRKYFAESPIAEVTPILDTRSVNNLQRRLVHTRSSTSNC